jgi:hypothetical protein
MRRIFLATPLAVIVALVAVPAAAQAVPHWYKKNALLGPSHVTVATNGTLTLSVFFTTIKCKLADSEEIWNPAGGGAGEDLVTSFTLSGCKIKVSSPICPKGPVEVLSAGLGWPSHLVSTPPPESVIRDEIEKVRLVFKCVVGAPGDEFEGTLSPEVGNGQLIFGGSGGGTLKDSGANVMTVAGVDKLKAPPGKITAKDP